MWARTLRAKRLFAASSDVSSAYRPQPSLVLAKANSTLDRGDRGRRALHARHVLRALQFFPPTSFVSDMFLFNEIAGSWPIFGGKILGRLGLPPDVPDSRACVDYYEQGADE